jgi:hypothetical protein
MIKGCNCDECKNKQVDKPDFYGAIARLSVAGIGLHRMAKTLRAWREDEEVVDYEKGSWRIASDHKKILEDYERLKRINQ